MSVSLTTNVLASPVSLQLRGRRDNGKPRTSLVILDPRKAAVVAVDVWTSHSCSGFNQHAAKFLNRMQETLEACRRLAMSIVFAPSGANLEAVADLPARKNILALPHAKLPESNGFLASHAVNGPFAAPCMCPITSLQPETSVPLVRCQRVQSDYNQHPALKIEDIDYFLSAGKYSPGTRSAIKSWGEPAQQELWNLVQAKGITHILYVGFASNMCIINREFAMIQARRMGLQPIIIRDLTLAITYDGYNPLTRSIDASFGPDDGSRYALEYIETRVGPSIESAQLRRSQEGGR
ncbi:MAG: hypothetical protein WKF37_04305 [Bryobacteraceae bacterium]